MSVLARALRRAVLAGVAAWCAAVSLIGFFDPLQLHTMFR